MANNLSHSSVKLYNECGRKYKLHYIEKWRSKITSGALLFGSAIDQALNNLLKTKDLEQSIRIFQESFTHQEINKVKTYLPEAINVAYSSRDFDGELLDNSDLYDFDAFRTQLNLISSKSLEEEINYLKELKKENGFNSLSVEEKKLLNFGHWLSLRRKGLIMLRDYNKKIIPRIKEVLTIQKKNEIINEKQDKITLYLDFIVVWEDGKRYLLDNKTSSMEYEQDSPMKSQQLIIYYHSEKQEFNLDGVGFVVLYKDIVKNRVKVCSKCEFDGSKSRHKTCPNEVTGSRCEGEWRETIFPEARIQPILNTVPEAAETLVIETFDEANEGIKKGAFGPNLSACGSTKTFLCPFYSKCWHGSDEDLIKLPE